MLPKKLVISRRYICGNRLRVIKINSIEQHYKYDGVHYGRRIRYIEIRLWTTCIRFQLED
jgi:hypothetical protein